MAQARFNFPEPTPGDPRGVYLVSRPKIHPFELGTYVFLGSLVMLFAASLIPYIRLRLGENRLAAEAIVTVPWTIWISTGALVAASYSLHRCMIYVRREKHALLRRWLVASCVLGVTFLGVQTWSLVEILQEHYAALNDQVSLYGIIFFLITLHALHVVGGLVSLGIVTVKGFQYRYDHECYRGLKLCAIYWHFLDGVWLVILATLLLTA